MPSPTVTGASPMLPSMFKGYSNKKKSALNAPSDAASYLSALSQMDAMNRGRNYSGKKRSSSPVPSTTSTPALSFSSSITASSAAPTDVELEEKAYSSDYATIKEYDDENEDGLGMPLVPPTSEQVFTTRHSEFGHCANEAFRHRSSARPGDCYDSNELDPPYRVLLTTYISYIFLICIGHLRDFFGKRFRKKNYKHLTERDVSFVWQAFSFLRAWNKPGY